ncbi:60S acidic ribosomal protein family [Trifolium repens]|nr:60S acidic ribosomal protein family [Trifolium repens]
MTYGNVASEYSVAIRMYLSIKDPIQIVISDPSFSSYTMNIFVNWKDAVAINMKVVAAYLLAVLGGNDTPSAKTIKDILGSVGAEAEDERVELFLSEIKGKDLAEVIASGREKLASVPSGGGVAVAAAPASGGGAAPAAAEAKKEEKVEEKEESDDDMGFSLFD